MAGSKTTRSKACFGLADLEDDMTSGSIKVKQEKGVTLLPPKRSHVDPIVNASGSRKRKPSEVVDFGIENLDIEEALR